MQEDTRKKTGRHPASGTNPPARNKPGRQEPLHRKKPASPEQTRPARALAQEETRQPGTNPAGGFLPVKRLLPAGFVPGGGGFVRLQSGGGQTTIGQVFFWWPLVSGARSRGLVGQHGAGSGLI